MFGRRIQPSNVFRICGLESNFDLNKMRPHKVKTIFVVVYNGEDIAVVKIVYSF